MVVVPMNIGAYTTQPIPNEDAQEELSAIRKVGADLPRARLRDPEVRP